MGDAVAIQLVSARDDFITGTDAQCRHAHVQGTRATGGVLLFRRAPSVFEKLFEAIYVGIAFIPPTVGSSIRSVADLKIRYGRRCVRYFGFQLTFTLG